MSNTKLNENSMDRLLEDQLCFEVYKASNGFSKLYRRALKSFELTFPQYLVLLALWESDRVYVKEISSRLGMTIGTINPILNRMVSQGWVEKAPSSKDKRAIVVSLTKKAYQEKTGISQGILKEISTCNLTDIDGELFLKNAKKLNKEFERLEKEDKEA
ncbi:MAG: MarR family transcriptional regulator [Pisciglobus halotolerans]|nr:MarR family transcriptional regulator [Pisciglobus halotolerans]